MPFPVITHREYINIIFHYITFFLLPALFWKNLIDI